jgi:hypothetical protein
MEDFEDMDEEEDLDELLAIVIEAEREDEKKRQAAHVCKADKPLEEIRDTMESVQKSIAKLADDIAGVGDIALEACKTAVLVAKEAKQKTLPEPKPVDYVMDVVRGKDDRITRIDVKAISNKQR